MKVAIGMTVLAVATLWSVLEPVQSVSGVIELVEYNEKLTASLMSLLPGFGCLGLFLLAKLLICWARARKGTAFAIGIVCQMFLPDPYAQRTIDQVTEVKETKGQKKKQTESEKE